MSRSRQILEAARAAIIAETALSAAQVHFPDSVETDPGALPEIEVFLISDQPQEEDGEDSAGGETRILQLGVSVAVASSDEAATDTLATQTRKAILQNQFLGGAQNTTWSSQEWGVGSSGSVPVAMTKLLFKITYHWSPEW